MAVNIQHKNQNCTGGMKAILTKHGEKQKIAKLMGVSHITVKDALSGKTNSELGRRIRKLAIERGGKES